MTNSILNGTVYSKEYDGWKVTWEADGNYRHWCYQKKLNTNYKQDILVIMFNPGSLSGNGDNLPRDTTLRVLRKVFDNIPFNCLVTNFYDYATPKPGVLIESKWNKKDKPNSPLIYNYLNLFKIKAYLLAYGEYETWSNIVYNSMQDRLRYISERLTNYLVIPPEKNLSGTPKHAYTWIFKDTINKVKFNITNTLKTKL